MAIDDTVFVHGKRIAKLEGNVNDLKVDTSNLKLTLEHQEDRQQERFTTLSTAQMEIKDIMKARLIMDNQRAEDAQDYREARERRESAADLQKQKWVQSLLTPQTLILILVVLGGLFGIKGIDMMSPLVAGSPLETAPPTGTIP